MNPTDTDRLRTLEERFAYLEKHVGQQDRAMLEMAERLDALEARLRAVGERLEQGEDPGPPANERPPHY